MKKSSWPKVIRQGSVAVKVYRIETGRYTHHVISYYIGKKRIRRVLADFPKAKKEAERIAHLLSKGEREALKLTASDGAAYLQAIKILEPFDTPLLSAIEEYAAAKRLEVPLLVAAKHYAARQKVIVARKSVAEIVEEFIQAKIADGMSVRYLADCRSRLGRFARDIHADIASVDSAVIAAWLRGLGQSGRSRNNYRAMVQALFRFARSQGYLVKNEPTAADDLPLARDRGGEIGIFKLNEFARLLDAEPARLKVKGSRTVLVPYFVLGGLCGLRHAEIDRMDWSDIDLVQGVIRVNPSKSKTATNRLIPICDGAAAWLRKYAKIKGQICSDRQSKYARDVARKLGIKWPANGLRHSYGSYRLAQVKNAPQVALEMGNTPAMIFRHYRSVVTEQDAENWFGITPDTGKKIIQFAEGTA